MDAQLKKRIEALKHQMLIADDGYYHAQTPREIEAEAIIEIMEKSIADLEGRLRYDDLLFDCL